MFAKLWIIILFTCLIPPSNSRSQPLFDHKKIKTLNFIEAKGKIMAPTNLNETDREYVAIYLGIKLALQSYIYGRWTIEKEDLVLGPTIALTINLATSFYLFLKNPGRESYDPDLLTFRNFHQFFERDTLNVFLKAIKTNNPQNCLNLSHNLRNHYNNPGIIQEYYFYCLAFQKGSNADNGKCDDIYHDPLAQNPDYPKTQIIERSRAICYALQDFLPLILDDKIFLKEDESIDLDLDVLAPSVKLVDGRVKYTLSKLFYSGEIDPIRQKELLEMDYLALQTISSQLGDKSLSTSKLLWDENGSLDITDILPPSIRKALSGPPPSSGPTHCTNCWNTALVSRGLLSHHRYTSERELYNFLHSPFCREKKLDEKPGPGDIVVIASGKYKLDDAKQLYLHAFMHISDHLAFHKPSCHYTDDFEFRTPSWIYRRWEIKNKCLRQHSKSISRKCKGDRYALIFECRPLSLNSEQLDPLIAETEQFLQEAEERICQDYRGKKGSSDEVSDLIEKFTKAFSFVEGKVEEYDGWITSLFNMRDQRFREEKFHWKRMKSAYFLLHQELKLYF